MSSPNTLITITTFLSIFFLLLHPTISADILSPLLSPFFDNACKGAICGKGKCKASLNHNFSFVCECDPGWKQTPFNDTQPHQFLPCVIPNCTLNSSCTKAPPPSSQVKPPEKNTSVFNPCNWAYCGEGSCMKKATFEHECQCKEGYANLLNITTFPCLSQCSLGMDCANLGLNVLNKSTNNLADSSNNNHASTILQSNYALMMISIMSLAVVAWA